MLPVRVRLNACCQVHTHVNLGGPVQLAPRVPGAYFRLERGWDAGFGPRGDPSFRWPA